MFDRHVETQIAHAFMSNSSKVCSPIQTLVDVLVGVIPSVAQRYSDAVLQCVGQCLRVLTVSSRTIVSLYDIISWYLEIVRPLLFPTAKNLAKYMKSCIERINAHRDQFPADPPLVSHFVSQHCMWKPDVGTGIYLRLFSHLACQTSSYFVRRMDCHGQI